MPFLIALALSLGLTPAARRLGIAVGLVDRPDDDGLKIHSQSTPLLGGSAAVVAAFGAEAILGAWLPWPVVVATGMALLVGLADDARSMSPALRMLLLCGAGAVLAMGSAGMETHGPIGTVALVLLVLACANAVNIMDGQDGLAGGVAGISALGLAGIVVASGRELQLALALAGGLGGFLAWNRSPARIFLGTNGAYAIGTLLAVFAGKAASMGGARGLLAAGAALGVFAFETAFTVGRRLVMRERLASGDRLHSYDLLATRWTRGRSTLAFLALAAICSSFAMLIIRVPTAVGGSLVAAGALVALMLGIWLWKHRPLRHSTQDPYAARGLAAEDVPPSVD